MELYKDKVEKTLKRSLCLSLRPQRREFEDPPLSGTMIRDPSGQSICGETIHREGSVTRWSMRRGPRNEAALLDGACGEAPAARDPCARAPPMPWLAKKASTSSEYISRGVSHFPTSYLSLYFLNLRPTSLADTGLSLHGHFLSPQTGHTMPHLSHHRGTPLYPQRQHSPTSAPPSPSQRIGAPPPGPPESTEVLTPCFIARHPSVATPSSPLATRSP